MPLSVFEGVLLPLHILKCSSCHIQIVITQEYAFCNFKCRFDKWRWRKLSFWRNTVMHCRIILKSMPNALSRVCTWELTWLLLVFIENVFLMDVDQNQATAINWKTVSRNLIFVNVISIVFEVAGITVKMVCKMTFDNDYRFWRILKSYFLRKTQQSLFIKCFFIPRYALMNTKFITL